MKGPSVNKSLWPISWPIPEEKPTIGLKPCKLHRQERIDDILKAMTRYADAGIQIPVKWLEELKTINDRIYKKDLTSSFIASEIVDVVLEKVDAWQQVHLEKPTLLYLGTTLYNFLFPNWSREVYQRRYLLGLRVFRSLRSPKHIQIC